MSENSLEVTITLSAPDLKDEQLQDAVQNLQLEANEVEGVKEASLIAVEEAPEGAKSVGGFLLDKFKALVQPKKLLNLVKTLANRLIGNQTIEFKIEKKDKKGKSTKLEFKISKPEDLEKITPQVNKLLED